ncbi:MAG: glycosyltransferase family 4 protein [Sphingobium sp.]|nr:glycosyltransferase family 4 protein [Sphingobium sp.]MCP5397817.1 glycosyltransferase family 4 protein [Sphingomonas sp.]
MRILQLCTNFRPGGIQRHVIDLVHGLRGHGHYVAMAGTRDSWVNEDVDPEFFHADIFKVSGDGGSVSARLWAALREGLKLRSFVKDKKIDLIHAHESAPALVAWVAAWGLNKPIVVTFHGAEPERIAEFGRIARMTSDLAVTPSHNSAGDLREKGGVPQHMLKVMGLGVQKKPRPPAEEAEALRRELLGVDGTKLVVTVARLAYQKAIDYLVQAAQKAVVRDPGLRFVVVGDGPQREDAERWIAEAGMQDHVRLIGHSDNAPLYMAAADLFFLSSRWEALPITIVEAFQQATPVLATDTAGVVELVDDSVGAVVPVGDIDAMADKLIALTSDETGLQSRSQAALERSNEDRFSPPHVHAAFEQLYTDILAQPKWAKA